MSNIKSPEQCLAELRATEAKFNDYKTRWDRWNTEYTALIADRTRRENIIKIDDEKLFSDIYGYFANSPKHYVRIDRCDRNLEQCSELCKRTWVDYYSTPLGKRLGRIDYRWEGDCKAWYELTPIRYCECYVPINVGNFHTDKNAILNKQNYINNVLQPQINAKAGEMPASFNIILSCCMNEVKCDKGNCDGNILTCINSQQRRLNANQVSQIELENKNNIIIISNSILNIQKEINSLSQLIYKESIKVWDIINNENIEETLKNLKIIYNNVLINFNKVQDFTKNLTQLKDEADKYNNTTSNESIYKNVVLSILEIINNYINNINNTLKLINDNHNFFKKNYDSIEKIDYDIKLLNLNKSNILSSIKLINDDIKNINDLYESAINFNILSDIDSELLLKMYNDSKKYLDNIIIHKENLNNFYTIFINIFNNIPKSSDFYNIPLMMNNEIKEKILEINNNIIKVNDTIKNINDIYILKKDLYIAKIIREEQLLLEGSEIKEKKNEENNNISNPIMTYIQSTPKVEENNKIINIILTIVLPIIGGFILLILSIYLYNRFKNDSNNKKN
jgi:hypothetical protein